MSTLSFQDYVRERMLRKRRAALGGDTEAAEQPAPEAPRAAPEPRRPLQARAEPNNIPPTALDNNLAAQGLAKVRDSANDVLRETLTRLRVEP